MSANLQTGIIKKFPHIGNFFIDAIFPKTCYRCGKNGSYLCTRCFGYIDYIPSPICPHCNLRLPSGILPALCKKELGLDKIFIAAQYKDETMSALIKDTKYKRAYKLAKVLAEFTYWWLEQENYAKDFPKNNSLIVPVPMHKKKERERGFNQATYIASQLSHKLSIPYEKSLIKILETKAQVETEGRDERVTNLKNVFAINKSSQDLKAHTIILIDDVITTGSTMRECARTLRHAGAREVWGLVVAKD